MTEPPAQHAELFLRVQLVTHDDLHARDGNHERACKRLALLDNNARSSAAASRGDSTSSDAPVALPAGQVEAFLAASRSAYRRYAPVQSNTALYYGRARTQEEQAVQKPSRMVFSVLVLLPNKGPSCEIMLASVLHVLRAHQLDLAEHCVFYAEIMAQVTCANPRITTLNPDVLVVVGNELMQHLWRIDFPGSGVLTFPTAATLHGNQLMIPVLGKKRVVFPIDDLLAEQERVQEQVLETMVRFLLECMRASNNLPQHLRNNRAAAAASSPLPPPQATARTMRKFSMPPPGRWSPNGASMETTMNMINESKLT